jgi:hypothetical protein
MPGFSQHPLSMRVVKMGMSRTTIGLAARRAVILTHLPVAALLTIGIDQLPKIPAQLNSGSVPDDYWRYVAQRARRST